MTNLHEPLLANSGSTPDLSLFATVAAVIPIVLLAFIFDGAGTKKPLVRAVLTIVTSAAAVVTEMVCLYVLAAPSSRTQLTASIVCGGATIVAGSLVTRLSIRKPKPEGGAQAVVAGSTPTPPSDKTVVSWSLGVGLPMLVLLPAVWYLALSLSK